MTLRKKIKHYFKLIRFKELFIPFVIFVIFLAIFSLTAYPGPGGRINYNDSAWKMLLPTSGKVIPHVTGFPIYIFISQIFYYTMPFHSLYSKITTVSICFGALSVVLVYLIAYTLSRNRLGSIFAAIALGFSYTFWTQATETEIYTLNSFFVLIVTLLFIKFYQTQKVKFLLWGNLFYALSFGNHLMVIWLLPALFYIVYKTNKRIFFNTKVISWTAVFILLGMLPYFFLYLRFANAGQPSLQHFIGYVTGGAWKGMAMFVFNISQVFYQRIDLFLTHLNHQFFLPGILTILIGIYSAFSETKNKTLYIFLLIIIFFQLFFSLNYGIYDIEVYFIPVYAISALFISLAFSESKSQKKIPNPQTLQISPLLSKEKNPIKKILKRNNNKFFNKSIISLILALVMIIFQLQFNLESNKGIRVEKNEPLENLLSLVKNIPPGSSILVPGYFDKNGDYKMLARYLSYTREYGNYKIIFQEEDTRIPYNIHPCVNCEEYYLSINLKKLLKKLKNHDIFYLLGNKNKRHIEKNKNFSIVEKIEGKDKIIWKVKKNKNKSTKKLEEFDG